MRVFLILHKMTQNIQFMGLGHAVILLPAHPASLCINLSLGCIVLISVSPRMQQYCRLVWTHKFAVGLIDMGKGESQDP